MRSMLTALVLLVGVGTAAGDSARTREDAGQTIAAMKGMWHHATDMMAVLEKSTMAKGKITTVETSKEKLVVTNRENKDVRVAVVSHQITVTTAQNKDVSVAL